MDAFLTAGQQTLRQAARAAARERAQTEWVDGSPWPSPVFEPSVELPVPATPDSPAAALPAGARDARTFIETEIVLEELSAASPLSGASVASDGPPAAAELGRLIGSAAFVLDACYRAARAKGFFASVLMEFRKAQMDLGDALGALEAVRLRGYRALLLLDRAAASNASGELAAALAQARRVLHDISKLGAAFCGEEWMMQNLPPEIERSLP